MLIPRAAKLISVLDLALKSSKFEFTARRFSKFIKMPSSNLLRFNQSILITFNRNFLPIKSVDFFHPSSTFKIAKLGVLHASKSKNATHRVRRRPTKLELRSVCCLQVYAFQNLHEMFNLSCLQDQFLQKPDISTVMSLHPMSTFEFTAFNINLSQKP